jgi:hypothetical protein
MQSPTFEQIWTSEGWLEYWTENRPTKNQTYYQFRSVCRMAFWIPLVTVTVYMFLSVVSVYS